jgi:hypothetical protein
MRQRRHYAGRGAGELAVVDAHLQDQEDGQHEVHQQEQQERRGQPEGQPVAAAFGAAQALAQGPLLVARRGPQDGGGLHDVPLGPRLTARPRH